MTPRKRSVAEVHEEQIVETSGKKKRAVTSKTVVVDTPTKAKKGTANVSAISAEESSSPSKAITSNGTAKEIAEKSTPKKAARKSNGKAKANGVVESTSDAKQEDGTEEVIASPPKKNSASKKKAAEIDPKQEEGVEGVAVSTPKKKKAGKKEIDATDAEQEKDDAGEETSSPPKKKRASKKKADEDDGTPKSLSAPPPGGSKMDTFAAAELPINLTIDDPLVLDNTPKKEGTTRIMSWNVLSLKSSMTKGFMRYIEAEQADVAILTETKCNEVPTIPELSAIYPYQTWGIGDKKGYAGIALLSKIKPIKVTIGMPNYTSAAGGFLSDNEHKGRMITAEYERYIIVGTYVVNAGENLKTLPQKQEWNTRFAEHLARCDAVKPTLWTGDLNVVLDARDLSNASKKWNKSAGYTEIECEHHRKVLAGTAAEGAKPYVDIWREKHPDAVGHYTYYGFRGFCRSKKIGWRLDTHVIPARIADQVEACEIRHTIYGASDHIPIYMDIKGSL